LHDKQSEGLLHDAHYELHKSQVLFYAFPYFPNVHVLEQAPFSKKVPVGQD